MTGEKGGPRQGRDTDKLINSLLDVARVLLARDDGPSIIQASVEGLKRSRDSRSPSAPVAVRDLLSKMNLFEQLFENTPLATVLMDSQDRAVMINAAFRELFGYSPQEVEGKLLSELIIPPDLENESNRVSASTLGGRVEHLETVRQHKNGKTIPVQLYGLPVTIDDKVVAMYGIYVDISARKEAEEQLRFTATHDQLTGLPNRTLFFDRIRVALKRARGRRKPAFAVLFLDLDRFKFINDSLGHAMGDQALVQVANRLAKPLRTGDTVGRLGGDEFGILVNDVQDRDDPLKVASRILSDFQEPLTINGRELVLTTSIGITFSDVGYAKPDEVLRDADLAMYAAKSTGAAGYRVFEPSMRARTEARLELEDDLREALKEDRLLLVYQPILNLRSGQVEALEALLRWRHPKRGLLQPCDFLPQAEEAGLATAVTDWVLDHALADSRELQEAGVTPALCINLCGRHFSYTRLEDVADSVLRRGLGRSPNLWLDVTENALAEDPQSALAVAERLRSSGMVLVLDDFGSGFSSLAQLRQLPLDILKLDRSFVQDAGDGGRGQHIVAAMVTLARSLGLRSCAEGIESRFQLQSLGELGCDLGQGRFISPPLRLESVLELLIQDQDNTGMFIRHPESKGNPPRTLP